jgi:signal transduction histidine kinase
MTTRRRRSTLGSVQDLLSRLWRLRPDPVLFDRILAIVVTALAEIEIWVGSEVHDHRVAGALLAPLTTASIGVRRRFPALVGTSVAVLGAVEQGLGVSPQIVALPIGFFCALYALTAWTPPQRFALGLGIMITANLASVAGPHGGIRGAVLFTVVTVVVMLLVRRVLGDRERRAELAERERDLVAREAVVEERARIARELHDAIAHNVSMMVVQAGAERRVLDVERDATRDVLETIEKIGRGALTEMRRLVGMLRSDAVDPLAPQPGLDDLPALVTTAKTHVARILQKLGLRDRVQVVIFAYESGLIAAGADS